MTSLLTCVTVFSCLVLSQCQLQSEDGSNFRILSRLISDCGNQDDMTICFKMKAVGFLDRLIRAPKSVPITEFASLVKEENAHIPDSDIPTTEQELDATLPRGLDEKSRKLDDLLWNKVSTLFGTRKIHLNFPTEMFEGRKKDPLKKGGGMMMMMMMGGMMMKMMMGGVAMMAGKAMMIGKIALILSLIMIVKKMGGGGGGGESHPQVVYGPPEHGGGGGGGGYHRRQMTDAQDLAYGSR